MAKGRKPTPARVKALLQGRSTAKAGREPDFTHGVGDAPAFLDAEAVAMWDQVVGEFAGIPGMLQVVDVGGLAAYCAAWSAFVATAAEVAKGVIIETPKGDTKINPALRAQASAMTQLRQLGGELGLSPASRARLQAPTQAKDEFTEFEKHARKATAG